MNIQIGSKVITAEHMNSIGEVLRINADGDLTIRFVTPERATLPLGHIATEFWPVSDLDGLQVVG